MVVTMMDEAGLDLDIICVDMDAFFASVEIRDNPSIRFQPVIVCGRGRRSVVASCSYEARLDGVHLAMPVEQAKRLCPRGRFVVARFPVYQRASKELHAILQRFTPWVEGVALDEAYLDVRSAHRLFGSSSRIAVSIREAVWKEMGLPCSVGVGSSKLVAKLASEQAKPRIVGSTVQPGQGVVVVPRLSEQSFLSSLEVSRLPGVGPVTLTKLKALGVSKVEDLLSVDFNILSKRLGSTAARRLIDLARGHDSRQVVPDRQRKSIGREITFDRDTQDIAELRQLLSNLADQVGKTMQKEEKAAHGVTIKLRFANFTTITRSRSERLPLCSPSEVARLAIALLNQIDIVMPVRLIGVSVSGLVVIQEKYYQQVLAFDDLDGASSHWLAGSSPYASRNRIALSGPETRIQSNSYHADDKLALALETVRKRFGPKAISSRVLVYPSGLDGLSE